MLLRRTIIALTVAGVLGASACSDDDAAAPEAAASCAELVREASFAADVEDQIRLFDDAIAGCSSQPELVAQMNRYPGIVGYPNDGFVGLRCADPDIDPAAAAGPVCASLVNVATTVETERRLEYIADTFDGERIVVTPDDVQFDGDVPAEIRNTVNIAGSSGCGAVLARRDAFLANAGPDRAGQIQSMYALHADRVATFIGCSSTTVAPAPSTTAPPG